MLRTIDRYVIREVVPPFVLSLLIFTFVLELPPVMQELERLLAKGVPWPTVGRIILLLSPQALGLTIPMALLVGLLIGLGRLSTDREAVALLACGVSPYRLLRPVLTLAGVATAATLYVMIAAIPDANQKYREILFATLSKKVESDVKPRVFFQDFPNWVLYPRNDAEPGQPGWNDVMLANTAKPEAVEVHMARHGRIVLDPAKRTVELILSDGTKYATVGPGESSIDHFKQIIIRLDPDSVFPPTDLARGLTEKTIAQLKIDIADKIRRNESTHNEVMAIHAKYSIPVACLVFAVIALALGLRVSRDGKLGGFVVGIGVIFAYYITMFLAESMAKGHRIPAEYARWVPNLLLGPFGIVALVWRARHAEGRLPFGVRFSKWRQPAWVASIASASARLWRGPLDSARAEGPSGTASALRRGLRPGVVLVIRIPRINAPMPSLIDRYISRLYVRVAGLSFLGTSGPVLHFDVHRSLRQDLQGTGDDRHDRRAPDPAHPAVHLLRDPHRRPSERARHLRPAGAQQRVDRDEGLRHQPVSHRPLGRRPLARDERRAVRARAAADGQRQPSGGSARRQDPRPSTKDSEPPQPALGRRVGQGHLSLRAVRSAAERDVRADDVCAATGTSGR